MSDDERQQRNRGCRAEEVAEWYFRLNGFLSIPGFIVHIDTAIAEVRQDGSERYARTEADFMGVRFPFSHERVGRNVMRDAQWMAEMAGKGKQLFVLVEVKAGPCALNGPWNNASARNMQRVIRRLGFCKDERTIEQVADAMYAKARWEGDATVFQYVCVGKRKTASLGNKYRELVQLDWRDVGELLFERFSSFPEKLPSGHVHKQWPSFGRKYGEWFVPHGRYGTDAAASALAIERFIDTGSCLQAEPGTRPTSEGK